MKKLYNVKDKVKVINRRMLRHSKFELGFCNKAHRYTYKFVFMTIITCGGNYNNDNLCKDCRNCKAYHKNVNLAEYAKESGIFLYMTVNKSKS